MLFRSLPVRGLQRTRSLQPSFQSLISRPSVHRAEPRSPARAQPPACLRGPSFGSLEVGRPQEGQEAASTMRQISESNDSLRFILSLESDWREIVV